MYMPLVLHLTKLSGGKKNNYTTVDPKQFVSFEIGTLCN